MSSKRQEFYASDINTTPASVTTTTSITKLSEGTITGAIIGTTGGVLYGMYKRKNVYFTGFIGMLIGGVVSKIITM